MDPRKKNRPAFLEPGYAKASSTNKYPNFSDRKMFAYYYSGTFRTKINCLNKSFVSWRPTSTRLYLYTIGYFRIAQAFVLNEG